MAENKDYVTTELENGTVNINEDVITTVAAAALRDVEGVVNVKNDKKNIRITLGEDSVAVDCGLVLLYGHSVVEIAKNLKPSARFLKPVFERRARAAAFEASVSATITFLLPATLPLR